MEKSRQTIISYDYFWRTVYIRGATVKDITTNEEGHAEGTYQDESGYVRRVGAERDKTEWSFL